MPWTHEVQFKVGRPEPSTSKYRQILLKMNSIYRSLSTLIAIRRTPLPIVVHGEVCG